MKAALVFIGLVLVFLLTGWIEPCEDGHKCPTPVATTR